jgi:hypothetical protein
MYIYLRTSVPFHRDIPIRAYPIKFDGKVSFTTDKTVWEEVVQLSGTEGCSSVEAYEDDNLIGEYNDEVMRKMQAHGGITTTKNGGEISEDCKQNAAICCEAKI